MSLNNAQVIKVLPKEGEQLEDAIKRAVELYIRDAIILVDGCNIFVFRNIGSLFNCDLQNKADKRDFADLKKMLIDYKKLILFQTSSGLNTILVETTDTSSIFERLNEKKRAGDRYSMNFKKRKVKLPMLGFFVKKKKEKKEDEPLFSLQECQGDTDDDLEIGAESAFSVSLKRPPRYEAYAKEEIRFKSYSNWVLTFPRPEVLAKAGFFFTGVGDLVRCFQCGIGLKDFTDGNDPVEEHVRHSGDCPYLPVLLGERKLAEIKESLQAIDNLYNDEICSPGNTMARYRHPQYSTLEARIVTFAQWPPDKRQSPRQLAEAGLYYTGFEDLVRCFACGGGMRRWVPDDDPWVEHCRWFPRCLYAKEIKGETFIRQVQISVLKDLQRNGDGMPANTRETSTEWNDNLQTLFDETKDRFNEMGFHEGKVKEAILKKAVGGTAVATDEEILDFLLMQQEEQENAEGPQQLTYDEAENALSMNQSATSTKITCMQCKLYKDLALFLPCTHLLYCMGCAESLSVCPVCERVIREKIRTFFA